MTDGIDARSIREAPVARDTLISPHRCAALERVSNHQLKRCRSSGPVAHAHTRHQAVKPPSTLSSCPVTYEEAGEARNTRGPLKSSGRAIRPTGTRAEYLAVNWSSCSASTPPGDNALTRTPRLPHRVAKYFVMFTTAAFDAP